MDHGTEGYFSERDRFRRRLAATVLAVSLLVALPFLLIGLLPRAQRERVKAFLDRAPVHFGFEGAEKYVERMNLDLLETSELGIQHPRAVAPVIIPEAHRGGGEPATARPDAKEFKQVVRELPAGEGSSEADIMARALRRAGSTPVFRSEQLVIETLVKPEYPEEAKALGIEGLVAVMALIDTLGQVARVELVTGKAGGVLERAAEEAVRRARFRPYRPAGTTLEVYAVFRFSFRLY